MKKWEYKVTNSQGLHARPAGLLVREARCGDTVAVTVSGEDEEAASQGIRQVLDMQV